MVRLAGGSMISRREKLSAALVNSVSASRLPLASLAIHQCLGRMGRPPITCGNSRLPVSEKVKVTSCGPVASALATVW